MLAFADVPLLTSIPAFSVGDPLASAFNVMMLSPIFNVVVLMYVVVPDTVRFPWITASTVVRVPFVLMLPVNVAPDNAANVWLTYALDAAYEIAFVYAVAAAVLAYTIALAYASPAFDTALLYAVAALLVASAAATDTALL
jgi:hypothetical protein